MNTGDAPELIKRACASNAAVAVAVVVAAAKWLWGIREGMNAVCVCV